MKADAKQIRHQLLRRLVATGEMHTQEELVEALRQDGISVTQATVSRDIVELGLVRTSVAGRVVYALPEAVSFTDSAVARRRLSNLLREIPLAFDESSAMLVVRTAPGMANMVAVTLDACAFPEIVGTVAGDDTILIALRSAADIPSVRGYLSTMVSSTEHE
jgi:transcriptional regulator of arginine metabolism